MSICIRITAAIEKEFFPIHVKVETIFFSCLIALRMDSNVKESFLLTISKNLKT